MDDSERRYTDQEVALVLARAAELEERRADGGSGARGLTRRELHEIAREVGLSPAVIDEAMSLLPAGAPQGRSLLGAPLVHRQVRGVPGRLDENDLRRLIRVVEDRVDDTGTVTEALGVVRWTSVSHVHKFDPTMQISLSGHAHETQIQVVRRYPPGIRVLLHGLPTAWGGMIGAVLVASLGLALVPAIGAVVASAGLGMGIGRAVWRAMSHRSARRVEQVVGQLVTEARSLAES